MAKLKKKTVDEIDLELLAMLYYLREATATDLEKEAKITNKIDLTKAGISKRLKWLAENGYLEKPIDDISTGKLRRIYKAPSKEKLKSAILEWYRTEVYEQITEEFITEISDKEKYTLEELHKEYPLEKAYTDNLLEVLSLKSAEDLRKLREGVSLKDAVKILEGYSELFEYEISGLISVKNGIVKLTEKGLKAVLEKWTEDIEEKLTELKELDKDVYKKLLAKFCKDIS